MNPFFLLNGHIKSIPKEPQLLIDYLRLDQHLTGTKAACREGDCGSCQVLVKHHNTTQWQANVSCLLRVQDLHNAQVLTIEAIPPNNPLIDIFSDANASQCGFCSPGLMLASISWLLNGVSLTEKEGFEALNGNLCRCSGYMGQRRAIEKISELFSASLLSNHDREAYLQEQMILPVFNLPNEFVDDKDALCKSHPIRNENDQMPIISGGTDLYLQIPINKLSDIRLYKNQQIEDPIKISENAISLNARASIHALSTALEEADCLPSFSRFTYIFASHPIRQRATLGGNLAHASPVGDGICYLMGLDAVIETNQRKIPIQDFFTGFKTTCLAPEEVITWIHIQQPGIDSFVFFEKVSRRQTTDITVVNSCAYWIYDAQRILSVRIVIGGASPIPQRQRLLEQALTNIPIHSNDIMDRISTSRLDISPISDARGSDLYREKLARQLVISQWLRFQDHISKQAGERV